MKIAPTSNDVLQIEKTDALATIVFCDIAGYAKIAAGLTPLQLIGQLNSYMTELSNALKEHNGTIAKFIGDALFAYWLAEEHPDHASLACSFAKSVGKRITAISKDTITRTGLHTGPIALVRVNHGTSQTLEPMGDTVNTASRIETLCSHYSARAITSDQVMAYVSNKEGWKNLGSVMIKGKDAPMTLYGLID